MAGHPVDFEALSPAEKILHVQDLWDRIAAANDPVPLTDAQRAELDRRLADHRARPDEGATSLKDVFDEIRARK